MLKEKILADTKEAMKAGDAPRLGVLRMLSSALNNAKIEKRANPPAGGGAEIELTDEEAMSILSREAKKRRESIAVFEQGGRADLAQGERAELAVIESYLPAQMSEAEIRAVLEKMIASASVKEFGAIMKDASREFKGKADGALVAKLLKELLS
jgi:uncharacterized protein YqeY